MIGSAAEAVGVPLVWCEVLLRTGEKIDKLLSQCNKIEQDCATLTHMA